MALKEQSPWEKGDLNRKELGHSEGSPSDGAGSSCCPRGGDREVEPSPPLESIRSKGKIKE